MCSMRAVVVQDIWGPASPRAAIAARKKIARGVASAIDYMCSN